MSIKHFQTALAKVISDPAACRHYLDNPDRLAADYDLTETEQQRLQHMIAQRGMKVNSMLYQMNRFTPLVSFLPHTIKLLDHDIEAIAREFWSVYDKSAFQFVYELAAFAGFVQEKIASSSINVPYLADILTFETAYMDIRFRNMEADVTDKNDGGWSLHPSARIIYMQHNPYQLLEAAMNTAAGEPLPPIDPAESFYIVKHISGIEIVPIPEAVAHYFTMGYTSVDEALFAPLVSKGLLMDTAGVKGL